MPSLKPLAFLLLSLLATLLLPSGAAAQSQIRMGDPHWGFDGSVTVNRFNLLTVELTNRSKKPFDGPVQLRGGMPFRSTGAGLVAPCFLAPGQTRTVQFHPFVTVQSLHSWWVDCGPSGGSHRLRNAPSIAMPATVSLGEETTRGTSYRPPSFDERLFPSDATSTASLGILLLDHAPGFRPAQRQALLDWLSGGGQLHLHPSVERQPVFKGPLTVLNDPRDEFTVGRGRVFRHERRIREHWGNRWPRIEQRSDQRQDGDSVDRRLRSLKHLVRGKHSWPTIFVVLALFFIASVPVHGWLSMRKLSYPVSIATLLGIVALFTYAMYAIGSRGYGEKSVVHSLSHARELAPGRFDVLQYKNVFLTEGGQVRLQHECAGSLFDAAESSNDVPGNILAGGKASFLVTIPVFTSRPFVHRGVFTGPDVQARLVTRPDGTSPGRVGPGFSIEWQGGEVIAARATSKNSSSLHWAELRAKGESMTFSGWTTADEHLAIAYRTDDEISLRDRAHGLLGEILAAPQPAEMEHTAVRVLVLCKSPDFLGLRGAAAPSAENGYVIYDLVLRPED